MELRSFVEFILIPVSSEANCVLLLISLNRSYKGYVMLIVSRNLFIAMSEGSTEIHVNNNSNNQYK